MPALAYGFWLFWTAFIIGNAANQAKNDAIKEDFKLFKETPHRQHIGDIRRK